jgi:chemotaxis protein MotA
MDLMTIIGLVVGFGAIIGGMILEGGKLGSISQLTAAIIVLGGTAGAVFVSFPFGTIILGIKNLKKAFFNSGTNPVALIEQILDCSAIARKEGLLSLEEGIADSKDPFFRKGLQLIIDGTEPEVVREILEVEIDNTEEQGIASAKVFEAAGGYSPTMGIIGAVLGLIHVMENLADPSKLGSGIAVAFVATVYGIGAANLLFLPIANKIKFKIKQESLMKEMLIEGFIGLSEGENPRLLSEKLEGFLTESQRAKRKSDAPEGSKEADSE